MAVRDAKLAVNCPAMAKPAMVRRYLRPRVPSDGV
jgi:hypothetical protein